MDQYTINNKRFIPIFIFIDDSGNEIGKWGPMAPEVEKLSEEMKASVPAKDHPDYAESFSNMLKKLASYSHRMIHTGYQPMSPLLKHCLNILYFQVFFKNFLIFLFKKRITG